MLSSIGFSSPVVWAGLFAVSSLTSAALAGITADTVVEYTPGTISSSSLQQNAKAVLGLPASVDDGPTSPFTPPFHASSITIIGAGGHVTLHLSSPLIPIDGADLGVFTNTGLVATTTAGITTATAPATGDPAVFSRDAAIISVSADDTSWFPLNNGSPIDLTIPSNAFIDGTLSSTGGLHIAGGLTPSDPFQPFTGTLSRFAGLSYPQMLTLFDGSFGGAWVDTSPSGLAQINYVRFDVPAGDRLVLDAVTGASPVPEPAALSFFMIGAAGLLGRKRSR